jgi:hypothetical protein
VQEPDDAAEDAEASQLAPGELLVASRSQESKGYTKLLRWRR